MLPELATSLSTVLATASLVFFVAVYFVVTVRVFRTNKTDLDARAHMALDDAVVVNRNGSGPALVK